jgi:hypothetical protein
MPETPANAAQASKSNFVSFIVNLVSVLKPRLQAGEPSSRPEGRVPGDSLGGCKRLKKGVCGTSLKAGSA